MLSKLYDSNKNGTEKLLTCRQYMYMYLKHAGVYVLICMFIIYPTVEIYEQN